MLYFLSAILLAVPSAEMSDTLDAVKVVADRGVVVSRTDTVRADHVISLTDALSEIPGIFVGDYGGAAGVKNVSLRGLGSPHTAIYFDGVRVGNAQNGQADLGMLDLGDCSEIVLDYAQNSLSFSTSKPIFKGRPVGGLVKFRGGSFGTYEPAARFDFKLTDRVNMSASSGAVLSKGDFPYGGQEAKRTNNDIKQVRSGLDFRGITNGGHWQAKAWFNSADRGTPGNVSWPSTDRQKDLNAFVQAVAKERFSKLYTLNASAKASYDDLLYSSQWGDSRYRQSEAQINTSHKFSICRWLDASAAADFQWDGLESELYKASRASVFATASAAFHPNRFKADIAIEYAGIFDSNGNRRNIVSPSFDLRWNAVNGLDIIAFGRRAYRMPTFNELYYPGYGNPDLKAEDAWLSDIGMEYRTDLCKVWKLHVKADGFFNYLKDKIISAPTEIPDIWLPYNVGRVQMAGIDLSAGTDFTLNGITASLYARYCFQNGIDKTPGSDTFGDQIPFISKHTACIGAKACYRGWYADIRWDWRSGRRDSAGPMPDYNTLDLTAGKDILLPQDLTLSLKFIARNLGDCRYELLSGYPMPGRSFYGEIDFKF